MENVTYWDAAYTIHAKLSEGMGEWGGGRRLYTSGTAQKSSSLAWLHPEGTMQLRIIIAVADNAMAFAGMASPNEHHATPNHHRKKCSPKRRAKAMC